MCDESGWRGTRVEYEPARPVWLELARALPPGRVRRGDDVPLRVQAVGIDIGRVLPAQLHAWQQTNNGDWYAEVQAIVVNWTERAHHETWLLAPASAVRLDRSRFGGPPINRNRLSVKEDRDGIVASEVHR